MRKLLAPKSYILSKSLLFYHLISTQQLFSLANVSDFEPEFFNCSRETYGTVPATPELDKVRKPQKAERLRHLPPKQLLV